MFDRCDVRLTDRFTHEAARASGGSRPRDARAERRASSGARSTESFERGRGGSDRATGRVVAREGGDALEVRRARRRGAETCEDEPRRVARRGVAREGSGGGGGGGGGRGRRRKKRRTRNVNRRGRGRGRGRHSSALLSVGVRASTRVRVGARGDATTSGGGPRAGGSRGFTRGFTRGTFEQGEGRAARRAARRRRARDSRGGRARAVPPVAVHAERAPVVVGAQRVA